ncbi:hypothetical protein N0V88_008137 [Collariella sp. IMI 366227]|nr:hypothetical protein N0V88_008137 [Collariella sp. IMI 366227]
MTGRRPCRGTRTLDSPDHYTVGWIAALPVERAAATALLDERHHKPQNFSKPALEAIGTFRHQDSERNQSVDETAALSAGVAALLQHMMGRERFEHIKGKAMQQLSFDNPTRCDTETMALMVACLNHQYRGNSVYFALLDTPGMDTATFPAPDVDKVFLFYRHDNGFWSVACIARRVPTVTMFDGISTLPSKVAEYEEYSLRDDEERRVRIDRFIAAIEAYLSSVGDRVDILFHDDLIFGDTDGAQSSVLCVAWAEARHREWRLHMWWNAEKQLGCWTPTTDDLVEAELKLAGDWDWIHVLYSRVRAAEFRVLVEA